MVDVKNYKMQNIKNDVLSGSVVAVALVPEAIAFSFIAGVNPIVGLYTAFMLGLITALFGGKPGMISGATGAVAVVLVSVVLLVKSSYASSNLSSDELSFMILQYVTLTAILAGFFQILVGVFKFGKFIRLVPKPAMYGFVNGLAIVIASAQFKFFDNESYIMYALVGITMLIMYIMPKFTKALPAGLFAIIALSIATYYGHLDTKTVGDLADLSSFKNSLPAFSVPNVLFDLNAIMMVLPYAFIIALVGLIESLLTMSVLDEMSNTHGNGNRECIAQGSGNIICGFFGAMPGCAMIGQSIINYTSGGLGRLSGVVASVGLIFLVSTITDTLSIIPVAVLVGIMFMVSVGTFEWSSFSHLKYMPRLDAFVMVVVTFVTVIADLAIAVIVGVIISALVFAWKHAKIYAKSYVKDNIKVYQLDGPLFFASVTSFADIFDVAGDNYEVVVDFKDVRVMDASGVEAIDSIIKKYKSHNKNITLVHLSEDCRALLKNSGPHCIYSDDDPEYQVAVDNYERLLNRKNI